MLLIKCIPPPPELHHSRRAAARAAPRPGGVLHRPHGTLQRPRRCSGGPRLHVLLYRPVRREWPLRMEREAGEGGTGSARETAGKIQAYWVGAIGIALHRELHPIWVQMCRFQEAEPAVPPTSGRGRGDSSFWFPPKCFFFFFLLLLLTPKGRLGRRPERGVRFIEVYIMYCTENGERVWTEK